MAITLTYYDSFLETLGDGTMNMKTDTFKLALLTNLHVFNSANTIFADVSGDEIAAGNGYTAGGETLIGNTYAQTLGVAKFDANDVVWTATGGPMATSRFAVLYDTTPIAPVNPLLALLDLGADKSPAINDTLTVQWDAADGLFRIV